MTTTLENMNHHNIVNETIEKSIRMINRIRKLFENLIRGIGHPSIAFILFFFIMFGLFSMVTLQTGDDKTYAGMHLKYNLVEFITIQYHTWSGRIFCDALYYYFTGTAQFLWKWFCAICITITAFIMYKFVIFDRKIDGIEKTAFAYLSCFSIILISSTILNPSVFWITGSLVYLVPLTFGLVAFIPFFHALKNTDYSPNKIVFLYLIPAILTVLSDEQISLCFISFSLLVLIFLLANKKRVPVVLWTIFISSLIFQIISLASPGNANRFNSEISSWFPAFHQISIYERISLSAHFLFNTIINQWYLFIFLLLLITAILLLKNKLSGFSRIVSILSFFFAFLMGLRFIQPLDTDIMQVFETFYKKLFVFNYLTKSTLFLKGYFIPYAIWSIAILIIPLSILLIFKKTKFSLFYIFIYLAAMASITTMVISPTMYESGGRTSFPSNMLLILLILLLLRHDGLVKSFALPIMIVALIRLVMYFSSWSVDGYYLTFGIINPQGIPFVVLGK